jgi:hypothetical protein
MSDNGIYFIEKLITIIFLISFIVICIKVVHKQNLGEFAIHFIGRFIGEIIHQFLQR